MNGWLVVNKTAGHTSSAIVQKLKWILNAQKAGHAGTLDPDATGILAIALGEATKTIPYLMNDLKSYIFTVSLGAATTTDDASGRVINRSLIRPKDQEIIDACKQFSGNIRQVPPNVSAVKVNGERAYKVSGKGTRDLMLRARNLWVEKLELIERIDESNIRMQLRCGKGGYVRSIARDIGLTLGCFGHVAKLTRTSSGYFSLSDSVSDKYIFSEDVEKIRTHIRPIDWPLNNLNRYECSSKELTKLKNGMTIDMGFSVSDESITLVVYNETPIAIGNLNGQKFFPKKVFKVI